MIGGFLGAGCRFLVGTWLHNGSDFPMGTFIVNLIGCFLLGYLIPTFKSKYPNMFYLLGTGFIGAFTTFSTFSIETLVLLENNQHGIALSYVVLSLFMGIGLSFISFKLALIFQERQGNKV